MSSESQPVGPSRIDLVSTIVVAAFGLFTLALGVWALIDTTSFYDNIAEFPPYNRHLLHDVGAFQVGLGAALLFALIWRGDAILVTLGGASAGAVAHSVAHVADDGMGGRSTDPYTLAVVAAILVLTFAWRLSERQRTSS